MKVNARSFKGIEYIQINDLPQAQQEKIIQTIDPESFIKILIDNKIISHCIQYKDYEHWFKMHYPQEVKIKKEESFEPSSVEAVA